MGTNLPNSNLECHIGALDQERFEELKEVQRHNVVAGRIISSSKELYEVAFEGSHVHASLSGKLRHRISTDKSPFPVVGDWVALTLSYDRGIIQRVLKRRNYFSRQCSGSTIGEQVVASNLDYLFIMMSLDQDFNLNRLERYLLMAHHGNVRPVVVLSKSDLCADLPLYIAQTKYERDSDLLVVSVSHSYERGYDELMPFLERGSTVLLVGSSGVGKSTLINWLVDGASARTGELSHGNGRGKCTTTIVRGFETTSGAFVIDAPGMRELQLWGDGEELELTFSDIAQMAQGCKFRDCRHQGEPGCLVNLALIEGRLTQQRFMNYLKLKNESTHSHEAMLENKRRRFKSIAIMNRERRRRDYGS